MLGMITITLQRVAFSPSKPHATNVQHKYIVLHRTDFQPHDTKFIHITHERDIPRKQVKLNKCRSVPSYLAHMVHALQNCLPVFTLRR